MLSSVAERVYWMARYAERAENIARIINVYSNLLFDLPKNTSIGWHSLVQISGAEEEFSERYHENSERNIMKFLLADKQYGGSLINSLSYARENARTIRGILPREGWEKLNEMYLSTNAVLPSSLSRRKRYEFLSNLIGDVQQLTGLLAGTMTHNFGYHFVRIGRNLERADMTSRILDTMTVDTFLEDDPDQQITAYDYVLWMNVLKSLSAYQSYRHEVQTTVSRGRVLVFILKNKDFPRAINHCLGEIHNSCRNLPRNVRAIRYLNKIINSVQNTEVANLNAKQLHQFMDTLQLSVANFHTLFSETYFKVLELSSSKKDDRKPGKKISTKKLKKKADQKHELSMAE